MFPGPFSTFSQLFISMLKYFMTHLDSLQEYLRSKAWESGRAAEYDQLFKANFPDLIGT